MEINFTSSVTLDDEDMVEKASFDLDAKVPYSEYVYEEYEYGYDSDESIILKGVTEMHMSFEMDLSRIDNGGTVSEFAFVSGVLLQKALEIRKHNQTCDWLHDIAEDLRSQAINSIEPFEDL